MQTMQTRALLDAVDAVYNKDRNKIGEDNAYNNDENK